MLLRLCAVLLALAIPTAFPGNNPEELRQKYGQPISEAFLIRPGIVVVASYGRSGNTCQLVIRPKEPERLIKSVSDTINYKLLKKLEDELVPAPERGKYKTGGFVSLLCPPRNDCFGTEEDWQNVVIYTNSGKDGANYDVIGWTRSECGLRAHLDGP